MNEKFKPDQGTEASDLQESKFAALLDDIRPHFADGVEGISAEELEAELLKIFRETKEVQKLTEYDARLRDVGYLFHGWLVHQKNINEKIADDLAAPLLNLSTIAEIEKVKKRVKGDEGDIVPFKKE